MYHIPRIGVKPDPWTIGSSAMLTGPSEADVLCVLALALTRLSCSKNEWPKYSIYTLICVVFTSMCTTEGTHP